MVNLGGAEDDMKSIAALSLVGVVTLVILSSFTATAQQNVLSFDSGSDFESGVLDGVEVVDNTLELSDGNDTGTFDTGLETSSIYEDAETNISLPSDAEATLTVEYYNDSQELDDSPEETEEFTLEDGQNEDTIDYDDSYDQINFEVELDEDTGSETPVLESFEAEGEKSGIEWTLIGFFTALVAVVILLRLLNFI